MSPNPLFWFCLGLSACAVAEETDTATAALDPDGDGILGTLDCGPDDAEMSPLAEDAIGDDVDSDCDGVDGTDADGDGVPSVASGGADCADDDATVHPGVSDECNGRDDDCNGFVDDGPRPVWSLDLDGDGVGSPDATLNACDQPAGYVGPTADCDDADARVYPNADEVCDGVDNDCDGIADGPSVPGWTTFYADTDGDGYGRDSGAIFACASFAGLALVGGDCNDGNSLIHPNALEICNAVDDDCSGEVDGPDALGAVTWHPDNDFDGWGDEDEELRSCESPAGFTGDGNDCDDDDAASFPGADDDFGDGQDQDCSGADG